jgi:hypothetical protein
MAAETLILHYVFREQGEFNWRHLPYKENRGGFSGAIYHVLRGPGKDVSVPPSKLPDFC